MYRSVHPARFLSMENFDEENGNPSMYEFSPTSTLLDFNHVLLLCTEFSTVLADDQFSQFLS